MSLRPLADCHLYGILDLGYVEPKDAVPMTRRMLEGGVDILQLRAKRVPAPAIVELAQQVTPVCQEFGVPFVLNDYPALVDLCRAQGAHIGQDDGPIGPARAAAGAGAVVGRSTHSLAQVRAACTEGADYLAFGPLFATLTKPDYVPIGMDHIVSALEIAGERPVFCIGGIKRDHLIALRALGVRRAVLVSGILQAADVVAYCRDCRQMLA